MARVSLFLVFILFASCFVLYAQAQGQCKANCENNFFCCQDACCQNVTESCCPDPTHGSVCCTAELTYCCPPVPSANRASRCCPRWLVCCPGGRDGCCEPDTMKPVDTNTVSSLFVLGGGKFASVSIDKTSGARQDTPVKGYDDWDEITRVFTYDEKRQLFYQLQANFEGDQTKTAHNVTFIVIDPQTGATTETPLTGIVEEGFLDVPGYAYNFNNDKVYFSVYYMDGDNVGYKFYTLSPTTFETQQVSSFSSANDSYVGWFSSVSDDGTKVYRCGFEDVVNEQTPGLSVTDISKAQAATKFTEIKLPEGLSFYQSFNVYANDSFVSLAADETTLNVVKWNLDGDATVVAKIPNAHIPPFFGPIAEYMNVNKTEYVALVVQRGVPLDKWKLVSVSFPDGTLTEAPLTPLLIEEDTSVTAIGLPPSAALFPSYIV